jgi:hypothetical protein
LGNRWILFPDSVESGWATARAKGKIEDRESRWRTRSGHRPLRLVLRGCVDGKLSLRGHWLEEDRLGNRSSGMSGVCEKCCAPCTRLRPFEFFSKFVGDFQRGASVFLRPFEVGEPARFGGFPRRFFKGAQKFQGAQAGFDAFKRLRMDMRLFAREPLHRTLHRLLSDPPHFP